MNINVIKDFRNDLLKRREVKLVINADKNPGVQSAAKMVADKFKSSEDFVVVKTLKSKFGRDTFLIDSFVYDSLEEKERVEPKKKVKKGEQAAGGVK